MIRRIMDEDAGFVKDVWDILALEALKNPHLIPDLSERQNAVSILGL